MYTTFGSLDKFAIQYLFEPNPYNEKGVLGESWGSFKLWISGKDICEYTIDNNITEYRWNLIYIIEWLCENMQYVLGYDPFPLQVDGNNSIELIDKANEIDFEEDDEDYLWHQAKNSWAFRHSWFCNRGGSVLSSVYFRRIKDNVEISWDNDFFRERGINFSYPKGVSIIYKNEFRVVMLGFLKDALDKLDKKMGNEFIDDRSQLIELVKKIKLLEPM